MKKNEISPKEDLKRTFLLTFLSRNLLFMSISAIVTFILFASGIMMLLSFTPSFSIVISLLAFLLSMAFGYLFFSSYILIKKMNRFSSDNEKYKILITLLSLPVYLLKVFAFCVIIFVVLYTLEIVAIGITDSKVFNLMFNFWSGNFWLLFTVFSVLELVLKEVLVKHSVTIKSLFKKLIESENHQVLL
ncbi:hypothetical protein ACFL0U_03235 [Pseudomonadota bacterium]